MAARIISLLARPWILRTLLSDCRLAFRLFREPMVPLYAKAIPVLAALYLVSPLDIVPDVFPLLGQLDDLSIVFVAMRAFIRSSPGGIETFHREAIARGQSYSPMSPADRIIDAEFRRG